MQIVDINGTTRTCRKAFPDPGYPGYMRVEFKNHHEWFTIKEFLNFNPELSNLTTGTPVIPEEDLGIVTSATETTLKDTKKNWRVDAYVDFILWISRGTGESQTRLVTKNSHNTLSIDKPWDIKPDKTSQYVLTHEVHDSVVHGNSLPVGL